MNCMIVVFRSLISLMNTDMIIDKSKPCQKTYWKSYNLHKLSHELYRVFRLLLQVNHTNNDCKTNCAKKLTGSDTVHHKFTEMVPSARSFSNDKLHLYKAIHTPPNTPATK